MTSSDPRQNLLDAAERLIAERGIDVPLRDIAAAAGNRNNSAVNYFFGSRTGLVDAVLERRLAALDTKRLDMLADAEAAGLGYELRSLVEILARPMIDLAIDGEATHYSRFLDIVRTHRALEEHPGLRGTGLPALRLVLPRLHAALPDIGDALREFRLRSMSTAMFTLIADYERATETGTALPGPVATEEIVDMLVAVLTIPRPRDGLSS